MLYTAIKVLLTAVLVVAISEAAKRSTLLGGILASLPLTSLLAFIWLYGETGDTGKIASLSVSIFWYVLPSLVLFIVARPRHRFLAEPPDRFGADLCGLSFDDGSAGALRRYALTR
jgi:hypothetical protein